MTTTNTETSYNSARLLELITKEQTLKTKLKLYETINAEYISVSKNIDTTEKKNIFNNLLNNLLALKDEIVSITEDITALKGELINFNIKIDENKNVSDIRLQNILNMMELQNKELIKNKQAIIDSYGSSNEFSKIYVSENIKYIFLFFVAMILIVNIITSIAVPYKTNLEKMILSILGVIGTYYLHQLIIKKV